MIKKSISIPEHVWNDIKRNHIDGITVRNFNHFVNIAIDDLIKAKNKRGEQIPLRRDKVK